jgi:hypothetical protein
VDYPHKVQKCIVSLLIAFQFAHEVQVPPEDQSVASASFNLELITRVKPFTFIPRLRMYYQDAKYSTL